MPKRRTISAFESSVFSVNATGDQAQIRWIPDFTEEVFTHINLLPLADKVKSSTGEWFFHLEDLRIDKNPNDPQHEDCIYGWFEGVRLGLRTDLRRLSTMGTRTNPKNNDESEEERTYFYLRLRDGLLLLDTHFDSVVTINRLVEYLKEKAHPVYVRHGVHYLTFIPYISQGFLEQLNNFQVIRMASIRLRVRPTNVAEGQNHDAIDSLNSLSTPTNAKYVDLILDRKHAKRNGLNISGLRTFFEGFLNRGEEVVAGVIKGSRNDGGSPEIKLRGIEEKHRSEFPTDAQGEVLHSPMFEYMIEIGNHHS